MTLTKKPIGLGKRDMGDSLWEWRYTGRSFQFADFSWLSWDFGDPIGLGRLKEEDESINVLLLPDSERLFELEQAEIAFRETPCNTINS